MNQSEFNKILGFCIAFLESEVKKQVSVLEDRIPAPLNEHALKNEILNDAFEQIPVKELPDSIVFESHLYETEQQLRNVIAEEVSKVLMSVTGLSTKTDLNMSSLKEFLTEKTKVLSSDLAEHTHDHSYSPLVHDHSQYLVEDDLTTLEERIKASLYDISSLTESSLEDIQTSLSAIRDTISSNVLDLSNKLQSLGVQSEERVKLVDKTLSKLILDTSQSVLDKLSNRVDNLSRELSREILELGQNKAERDHVHQDLARISQLEDLRDEVTSLANSIAIARKDILGAEAANRAVEKKIKDVVAKLNDKLNKGEALTKSDLDMVRQKLKQDILQEIPIPEDGKDAKEWEFQWHPTIKGRLMFKREDTLEWKWQDLIVKTSGANPLANYAWGAGGGDGKHEEPLKILGDGSSITEDARSINFRAPLVATSDSQGNVNISLDGDIAGDTPYVANLFGNSFTVLAADHGKRQYADIRVYNSQRSEVYVSMTQLISGDIIIESVRNLSGCYVVIKN